MLRLSGGRTPLPDPGPQYGAYPQPPIGAGHSSAEYDPRPPAVREARAHVRRQLESWGLADRAELTDTAELLVSELATHAVLRPRGPRRGEDASADGRFRLTLTAAHGTLRVEVTDAGRGGVSAAAMFLVNALARRWGCHQDGRRRTVWCELATCDSAGCG